MQRLTMLSQVGFGKFRRWCAIATLNSKTGALQFRVIWFTRF